LKIAVNTRLLLKDRLDGIGWFTFESLKRITQQHPEHEFYFIFDRPFDTSFVFTPNIHPVVIGPPARHPFLFMVWFEISIPIILRRIKPDLFLSTDGYMSLSTGVRTVIVIHDLNFEHFPGDLPWLVSHYYRFFFPWFARKAVRIATVSEYSKKDICSLYHIQPSAIDVVYNGAGQHYQPLEEKQKELIRKQYTGGSPYFIFVGALHPRKNLVNLFKAFDAFKSSGADCKLLIVGSKLWWTGGIKTTFESMQFGKDVIFTGRLPEEALQKVLASSLALTYVSYFEGFGIPVVEAFACEVPVITSNVTSLPEVAGDAAILTDPFSPDDIAEAMRKVFTDNQLRNEMVLRGKKQLTRFSWDQTADKLWKTIETALQEVKRIEPNVNP
jgi:glycosyltransferase involved in cell wall biosynthesis